jgi:hypothetical protein
MTTVLDSGLGNSNGIETGIIRGLTSGRLAWEPGHDRYAGVTLTEMDPEYESIFYVTVSDSIWTRLTQLNLALYTHVQSKPSSSRTRQVVLYGGSRPDPSTTLYTRGYQAYSSRC